MERDAGYEEMYYPLCGAIDFCALWLLIAKRKDKKRMKSAE